MFHHTLYICVPSYQDVSPGNIIHSTEQQNKVDVIASCHREGSIASCCC